MHEVTRHVTTGGADRGGERLGDRRNVSVAQEHTVERLYEEREKHVHYIAQMLVISTK